MVEKRKFAGNMEMLLNCNHYISNYSLLLWEIYKLQFSLASSYPISGQEVLDVTIDFLILNC